VGIQVWGGKAGAGHDFGKHELAHPQRFGHLPLGGFQRLKLRRTRNARPYKGFSLR